MAQASLTGVIPERREERRVRTPRRLRGTDYEKLFVAGAEIYSREAHCTTCHQANGIGIPAAGFPPLTGSEWATGDPTRLIKLTLKGLFGPIEVNGTQYPGVVPMTPFESLLNDEELASVLTYVRNTFGNEASVITPEQVAEVREEIKDVKAMYVPADLLKEHPFAK